ncbi:hypothetical protein V5738_10870 [Salinisphaera sp. SPP-AMP-43]|uniref:hypothetical protein n=1 Tax=Salinisphaera sp. SPP-AMP-43 TaxID=3121288 RepID=UPI003C6E2F82
MTAVSSLRPRVAAEAANCPNPVIDRALIDAARELCSAAPIWRDTILVDPRNDGDELSLTAQTDTIYSVPEARFAANLPQAYAALHEIEQAYGEAVEHCDGEMVRVIPPGVTVNDRPFIQYTLTSQRVLKVLRDPGEPLTVHVSVRPTLNATTLSDQVALDYSEGIVSGALYRLLRQAGRVWGNPQMALYHQRAFRKARADAIWATTRGFEAGSVRAAPRAFAGFHNGGRA